MSYDFPPPEYYATDEENKLEVLRCLSRGCLLADTVHKESTDAQTVHERDHPGLFRQDEHPFDYPDARLLNETINDQFISVHISAWVNGGRENPHYNLRYFRLTDKGQNYLAEHDHRTDLTQQSV